MSYLKEFNESASVLPQFPTTWKVAPGICWIQCNDPQTARRLGRLKDSNLVAEAVSGKYLRTYLVPWTLVKANRWVKRNIKHIYEGISDEISPMDGLKNKKRPIQQA